MIHRWLIITVMCLLLDRAADAQPVSLDTLADIHLLYYLFPQLQAQAMTP